MPHRQALAPSTAGFEARLGAVAARVEAALEALLAAEPAEGELHRPERLVAAMRHAMLGGGKRLRPFLVVETAGMLGRDGDGPVLAGCAVELIHGYSLVHDDLPAMDDDDLRRGRTTVHRAFDEATAILAGDALLTLAFDALTDPATDADAGARAELTRLLARAAGWGGMVGGQMLDLAAEGRFDGERQTLDAAAIRRLQAMKTGALLAVSVAMGATLGRAHEADRAALGAYGRTLGAAFQVADDVLDVEGEPELVGKAVAKDAGRGKGTLVEALGLDGAKAERDRLAEEAVAALDRFGPEADTLREAARFTAARRS